MRMKRNSVTLVRYYFKIWGNSLHQGLGVTLEQLDHGRWKNRAFAFFQYHRYQIWRELNRANRSGARKYYKYFFTAEN